MTPVPGPPRSTLRGLALSGTLLAGLLPSVAQAQVFGAPDSLPTSGFCRSVATADLDHDTHVDLVATAEESGVVSVWRGVGDGTFLPRVDWPTRPRPVLVEVGDWDNDTHADLLVFTAEDHALQVFTGDGLGGFATGPFTILPARPSMFALADLTGDGRLDVVAACSRSNIALFDVPGAPGGGFGAIRIWESGPARKSGGLAVGELDGQPGLDVYLAARPGPSRIYRNDGLGGLLAPVDVQQGLAADAVALGDFDGDGLLDAFEVAGSAPTYHALVRGLGGGAMRLAWFVSNTSGQPRAPTVTDINGDGRIDAVVLQQSPGFRLAGCPLGIFISSFPFDHDPSDLALADLDEDGDLDFISAQGTGRRLVVRSNRGLVSPQCAPGASVLTPALNFGPGGVGSVDSLTVIVRNTGTGSLLVSNSTSPGGAFSVVAPTQGINAGDDGLVTLRALRPTLGVVVDSVVLVTNAALPASPQVQLQSHNLAPGPPAIQLQAPVVLGGLNFPDGLAGETNEVKVLVTNTGESPLVLSAIGFDGPGFTVVESAPVTVYSGSPAALRVRHTHPASGYTLRELQLTTNDPQRPVVTVQVYAGVTAPISAGAVIGAGATSSFTDRFVFPKGVYAVPGVDYIVLESTGQAPLNVSGTSSNAPSFEVATATPFSIAAGFDALVSVRDLRTRTSTVNGTLQLQTDSPSTPQIPIFVQGPTPASQAFPTIVPSSFAFGAGPFQEAETLSVVLGNIGPQSRTVTAISVTGTVAQVTLLPPAMPFTLAPGESTSIALAYRRTAVGSASGNVQVHSSALPDSQLNIPWSGSATNPPDQPVILVDTAALAVELPELEFTDRTITVSNPAPDLTLTVTATVVVDSVTIDTAQLPPVEATVPGSVLDEAFPILRFDGGGHVWDIQSDGSIGTGDPGAYEYGLDWLGPPAFPGVSSATVADGGRTFTLSGTMGVSGLVHATRQIHVSPFGPFVRYLDTATNTGPTNVNVDRRIESRFDLVGTSVMMTSDLDATFETSDRWVVVQDDQPTVVGWQARNLFVFKSGGTIRGGASETMLPGTSRTYLHYSVQAASMSEAVAQMQALEEPTGAALLGLSEAQRSSIANVPLGPPLRQTTTSGPVPPGGTRPFIVRFDSRTGGPSRTYHARLHFVTNDPQRPVVDVPLTFVVGAGPAIVIGVPEEPGATLTLTARFAPNPARGHGLRLAYTLPSAGDVSFELFDVRGRRVDAHVREDAPAGPGVHMWNGKALPTGVYWTRVTHAGRSVQAKAVVLD